MEKKPALTYVVIVSNPRVIVNAPVKIARNPREVACAVKVVVNQNLVIVMTHHLKNLN